MPTSRRQAAVTFIERERVSAIIRSKDQQLASDAIRAAEEGGFRVVEFTLTTPGAMALIAEFSRSSDLLVGAGTVLTKGQAREAVSCGAKFLVSPIADREIIEEAAALDVACLPGAFTPMEMETAYRFGADFIKVFPAPPGGVSFVEAVLAPLPHLKLFPTAGFTEENFVDYLSAGCAGVGFVRPLFDAGELRDRNFASIRDRAARIIRRRDEWKSRR